MTWTNVRLIWFREIRDQLRDRRTVFMIAILPVLLYPLLGMLFLQITQFMQQQPTRIWIVGAGDLSTEPALFDGPHFSREFCPEDEARLLQLTFREAFPPEANGEPLGDLARREIHRDGCDAIVAFPADFSSQLAAISAGAGPAPKSGRTRQADLPEMPPPEILFNQANDASRIAADRVERVLTRWREALVRHALQSRGVSPALVKPFVPLRTDVSEEIRRRAAVWSRILPFVVVIWALTGAFYPAIDLCAGEKERGTLETLLCSPATRGEIVGGKLLTVICFSIATAYLNLLSLGATGVLVIRQIGASLESGFALDFGPPPALAVVWLLVATVPIAALFSALSLAVAAFAHSAKEGQYYLMPLLLISFPLMTLPMLPTVRLDLGTSIIPITGMVLWLRQLIEGQYSDVLRYAAPVLIVTAGCCALAIRWAVRQFQTEAVLFRQGERIGIRLWVRHIIRDRGATPSLAEALLCGLLILLMTFFVSLRAAPPRVWADFVQAVAATQLGLVAAPALIMTLVLARRPRQTLLLNLPRLWMLPAALLLAVCLHPLVVLLAQGIDATYPMSEETLRALEGLSAVVQGTPLWQVLLVVALLPAICEELAFRGFILSGLRHVGNSWAIAISSVLFGLTHGLLQQSLSAIVIGFVLGYLAVQTRSLLPCAIFHFTHNSLAVVVGRELPGLLEQPSWLEWLAHPTGSQVVPFAYNAPVVAIAALASLAIILLFKRARSSDPTDPTGTNSIDCGTSA
jgi:sodium transport system permease protein